ncbi:RND transporter [Leptotrichia sp.]|uniref:efflux RND transporter periplasmic adaptor subunit n=1 Tax=Leptotrichia sp. TaxID=104608 RepID=UPI001845D88A|nr:RND transporter [Leptotrichia sp.]MBB1535091.1 RND transporter [Leptotrichia sp.]
MKKETNENIIWLLPTFLVMIILFMIKTCTPSISEKYIVSTIKRENIDLYVDSKAKVEPKDLISIGLDVQLNVDKIYFKEGDKVKKGDVIIKFSDYKAQNIEKELEDKKSILAVKKSQLRYLKNMSEEQLDDKNKIQKLEGEIATVETELQKIVKNKQLVQRVITSPVNGYIIKINAIKNGTTDASIPVLLIAKDTDLKIVSEKIKLDREIKVGSEATVSFLNQKLLKEDKNLEKLVKVNENGKENKKYSEAGNVNSVVNRGFEAILYKIIDTKDPIIKILEFLPKNFEKDIQNIVLNETLNVRIFLEKKENVLTVPVSAVVKKKEKSREKTFIYVINKENLVIKKEIRIGVTNGEVIEIYGSGINEGQEIIVNPNDKLQNRIIVKRRNIEEEMLERQKRLMKLENENEKKVKEIEENEREIIKLKRLNVIH